jgi:oxygen-independent coproporphyrinogen-3 oxidase
MSGIYIHIPFCRQACTYCDFHFTVRHDDRPELVEAICSELKARKEYLHSDPLVKTIYFGGGTPSLLHPRELHTIMDTIRSNYKTDADGEITLEANPDDLSTAKLAELKASGINRLSIGIQSFDDTVLKFMNRAHNAAMAISSLENAAAAGFDDVSIDLIYGVPGQGTYNWEQNLEIASESPVTHISCYALTVEQHTLLHNLVKNKSVSLPEDDIVAEQFHLMHQYLTGKGFEHYEVSNFAKPGYRSKHNSSYWNDVPYLGIGPSANSFDNRSRSMNVRSNKEYIRRIKEGSGHISTEHLTEKDVFNEYIMTRLRTKEGMKINKLMDLLPKKYTTDTRIKLEKLIASGTLTEMDGSYRMPHEKWLVSDAVIRELFI